MAKIFMKSPAKGALMGFSLTGGWLLADLLLPEPWGDFVLYGAMAVLNIGIGWKLGRLSDSQSDQETAGILDPKNPTSYEIQS
ncbi:hypothetical protein E5161_08210 [Cohnella pontilimi]|uniref:Uncharacterized protein n=1 Tax=Cohnella pontilimi TaxID=2564100 RepID=A0A4U0FDB5_9BACL|nr:hypothetical protein [Cohnella pontilimi]TJY42815.1 hypothetical protein E5161_08210 [Cohnella pontilimi]